MCYNIVKLYWTGTRMTNKRGITSYEEANSEAAILAEARRKLLPGAKVSAGTNGYTVRFPIDGHMVVDVHYVIERDD